jgi:hypothetical protein
MHPISMRNRAILLLILSGLLAIAPWFQWHQQQAVCLQNQPAASATPYNTDDVQSVCPEVAPPSQWVHVLGIASVISFVGFLFFVGQGLLERRRDQLLLRGAGVYVPESELPLDE